MHESVVSAGAASRAWEGTASPHSCISIKEHGAAALVPWCFVFGGAERAQGSAGVGNWPKELCEQAGWAQPPYAGWWVGFYGAVLAPWVSLTNQCSQFCCLAPASRWEAKSRQFFPKVAVLWRKEKPPPEPVLTTGEESLRKAAVKATCPPADLPSPLSGEAQGSRVGRAPGSQPSLPGRKPVTTPQHGPVPLHLFSCLHSPELSGGVGGAPLPSPPPCRLCSCKQPPARGRTP